MVRKPARSQDVCRALQISLWRVMIDRMIRPIRRRCFSTANEVRLRGGRLVCQGPDLHPA
jgi:hypothetical protein